MEEKLVETIHPSRRERFKVRFEDLEGPQDGLIPLYELTGEKRSRADAWMGSGRPSDITRADALAGLQVPLDGPRKIDKAE